MTDGRALPSVEALAYLGDAVFSLLVRRFLVESGISHAKELNRLSLAFVTAPHQARLYRALEAELTEAERDIFRRAYNHKGLKPPKSASGAEYRTATGLEAVIGALYLCGETDRIRGLLSDKLVLPHTDGQ